MVRKKKSTIEDVVSLSGVSRSTVDRVLNQRTGVRQETVTKVEAALKELGYKESALANRISQENKFVEAFLSAGSNPSFALLHQAFEAAKVELEYSGIRLEIRSFDPYDPSTLVKALQTVDPKTKMVATVGVETPQVSHSIDQLVQQGVKVITILSDVPTSSRHAYVGQDNFTTGRIAGSLMSKMVRSTDCAVAIVTGHLSFRHLLDRQSGFHQLIGTERPEIQLIQTSPYGTDEERGRKIIEDLFEANHHLGGLYLAGGGQPAVIDAISRMRPAEFVVIGHELNPITREALETGTYQVVLNQNMQGLADAFVRMAKTQGDPIKIACKAEVILKECLH